jgi:hypothetical protein
LHGRDEAGERLTFDNTGFLLLLALEPGTTHEHAKSHAEAQSHGDELKSVSAMHSAEARIIETVYEGKTTEQK